MRGHMHIKEFFIDEKEPTEIIISKIDDYIMDIRAEIFEELMNRKINKRLDKIIFSVNMIEKI